MMGYVDNRGEDEGEDTNRLDMGEGVPWKEDGDSETIFKLELKESTLEMYKQHARQLFALSWPNVITALVQLMTTFSSMFFLSHLGPTYLAAASLGSMICNASGYSFGFGLSSGLDTLCTQAFGAKKYKLVGLHFQRAMVILTLSCIPIVVLWMFTSQIFKATGVDAEVADHAQIWVHYTMLGLWPSLIYEAFKKFLLSQQIVLPQTISTFIVCPAHIGYSWLLIHYFGFIGAAIANSISNWLWLIVTLIIYLFYKCYKMRGTQAESFEDKEDEYENSDSPLDVCPRPSMAIFKGWLDYLKLGVPASLSLALEWGSWEVNALIVAWLPNSTPILAAHSVLCNTVALWYMPALGIATALTTSIGNTLGDNNPKSAKIFLIICMVFVILYSTVNGMSAYFYRNYWAHFWTEDEEVVSLISNNLHVLWLYSIVDVQKCIASGVLRACGRNEISLGIFVLSTIAVGYPISIAFGFVLHFSLTGIWYGMTLAWTAASFFYYLYIYRIDWEKEARAAEMRNYQTLLSTKTSHKSSEEMRDGSALPLFTTISDN
uniref:Multidrug and toxin extrusion protein n=1 Tax=Arcella intermedia TaxID=1963864 RepID=A0A6B2L184_9EUKA